MRSHPWKPGAARPRGRCGVAVAAAVVAVGLLVAVPARAQERPPTVEHLDAGTVLPADLPFSEAVRLGGTLYLSGMVGVAPGTDSLVAGGIRAETRRTMENIGAVLRAHGSSRARVVKCTVFLADIGQWDAFNEVYRTYFEAPYPARSALGADGLALDARVEVDCVAAVGDGGSAGREGGR